MQKHTVDFLQQELRLLLRELQDFRTKNNEAVHQVQFLSANRRILYNRCKTVVAMAKESPEIFKENPYSYVLDSAQYFVHDYEREEKENPVEILLNWSSNTGEYGESFILSQIYGLLGKDDARTFRALLRDVVMLADPTRAGDV